MDFIAYLETTKEYEPSDVVVAFHKALERGAEALKDSGNDFHSDILIDIMDNNPIVEQEQK